MREIFSNLQVSRGTNFLLAWHKIVSIAFIKTDEENAYTALRDYSHRKCRHNRTAICHR